MLQFVSGVGGLHISSPGPNRHECSHRVQQRNNYHCMTIVEDPRDMDLGKCN